MRIRQFFVIVMEPRVDGSDFFKEEIQYVYGI